MVRALEFPGKPTGLPAPLHYNHPKEILATAKARHQLQWAAWQLHFEGVVARPLLGLLERSAGRARSTGDPEDHEFHVALTRLCQALLLRGAEKGLMTACERTDEDIWDSLGDAPQLPTPGR